MRRSPPSPLLMRRARHDPAREDPRLSRSPRSAGLWFLWRGYESYQQAYNDRVRDSQRLDDDLFDQQLEVRRGKQALRQLERYQSQSLPTDPDVARSDYSDWLKEAIQSSGLELGSVKWSSTRPEGDAATALTFSANASGSPEGVVRLLDAYHRLDALHQLTNLQLRPIDDGGRSLGDHVHERRPRARWRRTRGGAACGAARAGPPPPGERRASTWRAWSVAICLLATRPHRRPGAERPKVVRRDTPPKPSPPTLRRRQARPADRHRRDRRPLAGMDPRPHHGRDPPLARGRRPRSRPAQRPGASGAAAGDRRRIRRTAGFGGPPSATSSATPSRRPPSPPPESGRNARNLGWRWQTLPMIRVKPVIPIGKGVVRSNRALHTDRGARCLYLQQRRAAPEVGLRWGASLLAVVAIATPVPAQEAESKTRCFRRTRSPPNAARRSTAGGTRCRPRCGRSGTNARAGCLLLGPLETHGQLLQLLNAKPRRPQPAPAMSPDGARPDGGGSAHNCVSGRR